MHWDHLVVSSTQLHTASTNRAAGQQDGGVQRPSDNTTEHQGSPAPDDNTDEIRTYNLVARRRRWNHDSIGDARKEVDEAL
jgi:hypothetical protein